MEATGYGPRRGLIFDGDETRYEIWEAKFLAHMRLVKLHGAITAPEDTEPMREKNKDAFAQLIQCLDDRSISLVIRDADGNGREALKTLRAHYLGSGKPRILTLYRELTNLTMGRNESITDYVIRSESAVASLKSAGETFSDSLLICMVMKGLPSHYDTFVAIINHNEEDMSFSKFKAALKSHAESIKPIKSHAEQDSVMTYKQHKGNNSIVCYKCSTPGHKANECVSPVSGAVKTKSKWCDICKTKSHYTRACRKKGKHDHTKTLRDNDDNSSDHTFVFKVSKQSDICDPTDSLLVDTGATAHIVTNKSKFVSFDQSFVPDNHFIELADGMRTSGIVEAKGNAVETIHDSNGKAHNITLKNALYIPSYKQNILSVEAATKHGASVNFTPNTAFLSASDGTKFPIMKEGKLYYMCNAKVNKSGSHTAEKWHEIMGHCNRSDILKLENVVEGMHLTDKYVDENCSTCIRGKMTHYRSREPDARATKPLELVHSDLYGPVDPVAKDGFVYAISFTDDYTGTIFIYFLKNKSDALQATEKFLADAAPYGQVFRLRTDNGGEYVSNMFKTLMIKNKIKHEFSAPYSPHQKWHC